MTVRAEGHATLRGTYCPCVQQTQIYGKPPSKQKETALWAVPREAASFAGERIHDGPRTMSGLAEHCKNIKMPP